MCARLICSASHTAVGSFYRTNIALGLSAKRASRINLDDNLVRRAMSIHQGKTKTAVLELGLSEASGSPPNSA